MENTFSYRHFLICNEIANNMMGHQPQNFAELIVEEDNGRYANGQMTKYFYVADRTLCELTGNDEGFMWDDLDMDEVAKIPIEELQSDYEEYCKYRMVINVNKDI